MYLLISSEICKQIYQQMHTFIHVHIISFRNAKVCTSLKLKKRWKCVNSCFSAHDFVDNGWIYTFFGEFISTNA